ncbi:hypothetical protein B0H16DRAFT_1462132 [Mycena metata]|uniref:Protein kinase domain-containing protein n=1 Tax=Mycena metata TaxID=1033252 RepID=A0AAD7INT4_9AGAR|nr:hypothetical protein B0H16DRAFT_1462132 [Mycena metata]
MSASASQNEGDTSLRQDVQELQDRLDRWIPHELKHVGTSTSTTSRSPSYFELHLSATHQLKRIVVTTKILEQIMAPFDRCREQLVSSIDQDAYKKLLEFTLRSLDRLRKKSLVATETGVETYFIGVGDALSGLASDMLFLMIPDVEPSELQWQADLFNIARAEARDISTSIVCPQNDASDIPDVARTYIRNVLEGAATLKLMSEQTKSLPVANQLLRAQIPIIVSKPFEWTTCNGPTVSPHELLSPPVTPDSMLWNLPSDIQPSSPKPDPTAAPSSRRTRRNLSKPSYDDPSEEEDAQSSSQPPTKRRRLDSVDRNYKAKEEKDGPNNKAPPEYTVAHDWLQQAYSQACNNDETFVKYQGGNWEMTGFRHRASQTLYLSPIIAPREPGSPYNSGGYTKLLLATYLAAFFDYADRKGFIVPGNSKSRLDGGGGDSDNDGDATQDRLTLSTLPPHHFHSQAVHDSNDSATMSAKSRKESPALRPSPSDKENMTDSVTGVKSMQVNEWGSPATMQFRLQFGVYDSVTADTFVSIGSPTTDMAHCLHLTITQEVQPYVAYRGHAYVHHPASVSPPSPHPLSVFAKLAFGPEAQARLRNIGPLDGLPQIIGLFGESSHPGAPLILVMSYEGGSLAERVRRNPHFKISLEARDAYLDILKQIHRSGHLHGDCELRNLLIDDDGHVAIVDLGLAKESDGRLSEEMELGAADDRLQELLE